MKGPPQREPTRHVLTPLRVIVATAPSGGESRLIRYTNLADELSWYAGKLLAAEEMQLWKAILAARKPGVDAWNKAAAVLTAGGWSVRHE